MLSSCSAGHLWLRAAAEAGSAQEESGIWALSCAEQQCTLSECFGAGALHSTHGVHPEAPCRDIFRLSNDPDHGFNSVGPNGTTTGKKKG